MKVIMILGIILVVLVVLYFLMIMPRMINRPDFEPFTHHLYAHRGLYDNSTNAPENSLNAFQKAVENGYGIELDIQLTKDEVMVVAHDFDLKRICGADVKIRDLTFEELQEYKIFSSDQTIPKFEDVLKLIDGQVPLIVEYKVPDMSTKTCEMGNEMLTAYQGLYCVESFNPIAVLWYRNHNKTVVRGFLSDDFNAEGYTDFPKIAYWSLTELLYNWLLKPDFIAYDVKYYDNGSRKLCKNLYHAPSVAWTVQSQQQLEDRQDDFDIFIFEGFVPEKN